MLVDPALSTAIEDYEAALYPLALRLVGRDGADLDDLIQEGRISIWGALVRDADVSMDIAFKSMLAWVRHLRPQNPGPYDGLSWADDGG